VLTVTPAIILNLPLYPWTAKHVGLTTYFMTHGTVRSGIGPDGGIYQSWPALFASIGWLCHVAGISNPMVIARWWPPVIDLLALIAFRQLADRVGWTVRQAWIATTLFFLGNTIGQDYFSPQAVSYFLAIIIFGIAIRPRDREVHILTAEWVVFIGATLAIVVTHQLTPFMVTAALIMIALFGYAGSLWMPVITVVPALLWTGTHYSSVSGFLNPNVLGDVIQNLNTPGSRSPELRNDIFVHLSVAGQALALLMVGLLALAVLLRWRTRLHLMLACCAASGAGLFVVSAYGNEGIFRVSLFALPWLALLAVHGDWGVKRGRRSRVITHSRTIMSSVSVLMTPFMLVAYLLGIMGIDYVYIIHDGDLAAINHFERTARPSSELITLGYGHIPVYGSGIYNNYRYANLDDIVASGFSQGKFNAVDSVTDFTAELIETKIGSQATPSSMRLDYYAIASAEAFAESDMRGLITPSQYRAFTDAMEHSPYWTVVDRTDTAVLFKFTIPRSATASHPTPSSVSSPIEMTPKPADGRSTR
jgi:hypothetical protein